ncbi:MAG: hypothetical protein IKK28_06095 [Mogibacterium sp.]|jgi:PTS system mannose-specific IIA component|nr:hypothetical protein [Solobacterium sp.]MBR3342930.1 hypothetical protein [Solobacterium sp.]MBR4090433.1 hypothetical protein [Mogibacterium sp.]
MRKILLISHFGLAGGMLSTMSYFGIGGDNCTAINAYENDLDPKGELEKFWAGVKDEDQVLIFTDIMGGSVNQLVTPCISRPNTYVFAGMNFPMLITAATLPEDATEEEIRHVAAEAKNGVVLMNDFAFSAGGDEDE